MYTIATRLSPGLSCKPITQPRRHATRSHCKTRKQLATASSNCSSSGAAVSSDKLVASNEPLLTRRHLACSMLLSAGISVAGAGCAHASTVEQVAETIRRDFVEKQYYVTGKLTDSIYDPGCLFIDPTTTVKGVKPYTSAVASLFDPKTSKADLISLNIVDDATIMLRWRLEGSLQLGGLKIKPYTGTTKYTIGQDGLLTQHEETWDISALDAFVSTLIPGFGAPPAPPV